MKAWLNPEQNEFPQVHLEDLFSLEAFSCWVDANTSFNPLISESLEMLFYLQFLPMLFEYIVKEYSSQVTF